MPKGKPNRWPKGDPKGNSTGKLQAFFDGCWIRFLIKDEGNSAGESKHFLTYFGLDF